MLVFPVGCLPFELNMFFFGERHYLSGKRRAVRFGIRSGLGGLDGLRYKGVHALIYTAFTEKLQPVWGTERWIGWVGRIFINSAIEVIEKHMGIRLKYSACRDFLIKIGLKCRRVGVVPGKAIDDEKQQQAQQDFHDEKLQPVLEEAKQGKRTVLFVDAAHFVMGAFLGMVWCFIRVLLPSSCGRKRYNVLGAFNPITHEVITITNETYINQVVLVD